MLLNEKKASRVLGLPYWTVRHLRKTDRPLVRYLMVDGRAYYDVDDLESYRKSAMVETQGKVSDA